MMLPSYLHHRRYFRRDVETMSINVVAVARLGTCVPESPGRNARAVTAQFAQLR